ncbi:hypothetical protein THAOC_30044, partial [Thalassiosira oceanica]
MDELADTPANRVVSVAPSAPAVTSLPVWLQDKSKVSMLNDDDFAATWPRLTCDNIILPSWNVGLYTRLGLKPSSPPYDPSGKLVVSANHVSAKDLKSSCPKSLREALDENSVDRDIWLASYHEEKNSLLDNKTFVRLSLQQYRELRLKKNA